MINEQSGKIIPGSTHMNLYKIFSNQWQNTERRHEHEVTDTRED